MTKEILAFIRARKKYWLAPAYIVMFVVGLIGRVFPRKPIETQKSPTPGGA